ncbi:MAG: hypothetical protein ABW174_11040 [Flavitalea sp.]
MKRTLLSAVVAVSMAACGSAHIPTTAIPETQNSPAPDTSITQSLFTDRQSNISEENIAKILDGNLKLPAKIRVAVFRLEPSNQYKRSYWSYWNNEDYLKTQQSYLDLFSEKLKGSSRVKTLSVIPEVLLPKAPTFTNIREAAVRMQADVVVIYSISSDLYSKQKMFAKTDMKAFATTQLVVLDVRTGLIPFSRVSTKDSQSQKQKTELDNSEAATRIQNEAVLLTINDIANQINSYLAGD